MMCKCEAQPKVQYLRALQLSCIMFLSLKHKSEVTNITSLIVHTCNSDG